VCRALADSPELKDVPVVLMSAKGDQVGERFVKVMGIVDYITKPFSPEAITAVVQHTIRKYTQKPTNGEASGLPEGPTDDQTSPRVPVESPFGRRLDAVVAFREALAEALSGGEIADLGNQVRSRLDDATLDRLLEQAVRAYTDAGGDDGVSLRGNVAQVPIAEVLTLLQQQRQWGTLTVTRPEGDGEQRIEVYFKQGRVELALAQGLSEEFFLGRYLVDQGAMSKEDLDLFLKSRSQVGKPIGEQLLKLSYFTEGELKAALKRQSAERIYELLRWPSGRFFFRADRELPPLALEATLAIDVDGVLMEGFRRVDEWHLIEREVDDFDAVYLRNEEAVQNVGKAKLTRDELTVLELVNGKNTVKDIVRQSRLSSFDVSKMLFRLLSIKLIRRRVAPVAV
jgi:hypothetical protein